MSRSISLDTIVAAANDKYASLDIEVGDTTVKLVNALQLPKKERDELIALQDSDSEDSQEVISQVIRLVADTPEGAELLLSAVGDNLAALVEILGEYNKDTQAGEA